MFGKRKHERRLESELRFHLEQQVADYIASGMDPEEARRRAHLDFGGLEQMKEACRDERKGRFFEQLVQDLRYGTRVLGRARVTVALMTLVIALGVGANMTAYSIADGFVLRPLPLPGIDRVVEMAAGDPNSLQTYRFPPTDFIEWSGATSSFEAMAGYVQATGNLSGEGDPEVVDAMRVSADFFRVFGVTPLLGRGLTSDDPDSAVISHALWVRHFGANPNAVGKTIEFADRSYVISGVIPREFRYLPEADLWMPLVLTPQQRAEHISGYIGVLARLRDGASVEQAQAELAPHAARLAEAYPESHSKLGPRVLPLARILNGEEAVPYIGLLWAASLLVLLIAIANVANVQFARASMRRRELAVRTALGAGRWRLIRQLLTENALVGALACVAGTAFAVWTAYVLRATIPASLVKYLAGWDQFTVSPRVLMYGLVVALFAGLLAGLVPALAASATAPGEGLKEGQAASAGRRRHRMRAAFVLVQVSLSIVLLVGAAAVALRANSIGEPVPNTDPDSAFTMKLILPESRYPDDVRVVAFQQRLLQLLEALPGVDSAAMVTDLPYSGEAEGVTYGIEGRPPAPRGREPFSFYDVASDGYFEAMHVPLLEGRLFTSGDTADAPRTAIVCEALAKKEFGNQSPIGRRIRVNNGPWRTIVGVVKHVRQSAGNRVPLPIVYVPYQQAPSRGFDVILRSTAPPLEMTNTVRAALRSIDPVQPAYMIRTLRDVYYNQTLGETFAARIIGAMGVLALLLSAMGVFSVVANAAVERRKEVAIRMAFGARSQSMIWMVVRQGVGLTLAGAALGIGGAVGFCQLLASALPIEVPSAWVFAAVAGFLVSVAIPACVLPARRAALGDPAVVLRSE